jgi:hypothetical protein
MIVCFRFSGPAASTRMNLEPPHLLRVAVALAKQKIKKLRKRERLRVDEFQLSSAC